MSKRRNIVLILCDQLRPDFLSAYGANFIPTPNIDALAENGVTFDNSITASTVCAPARASIVTGEFVSGHCAWTNGVPCKNETVYLPERLNEAGYMTAAVGCFDHAPLGNNIGYKYTSLFLEGQEGDKYFEELKKKHPDAYTPYMSDGWTFKYPEEDFYDRWSTDRAVDFINSYTANGTAPDGTAPDESGSPFFLYCGLLSPHMPLIPPKEVSGTVDPSKIPEILVSDRYDDVPAVELNRRIFLNPTEAITNTEEYNKERQKFERPAYCDLIVEVDNLVGRIINSLKENGIYEDTTIIFASDHGSAEWDYNMWTKGPCPYKSQLFVPLIVSNHPDIDKNTHSDCLCGNLDIGATVLDIAGDTKRFGVSRSLIGMVNGSIPERRVNMSEFCDSCKTIVDKRYTFSYYPFTGKTCLFDRVADPLESKNLGGKPEYAEIEKRFIMDALDFMLISRGVHIEAWDFVPEVQEGLKEKDPKYLENFEVAYPIGGAFIERLDAAGLPSNYNDFCRDWDYDDFLRRHKENFYSNKKQK